MAVATLGALRRLGVQLAVDDFGTEYSSFAYLQKLPVDVLKIDKSFVDGLSDVDTPSDSLVAAIIALARALDIGVVAEGVETGVQAKRLCELGCESVQGYLYSRPVRADQLPDVIGMLQRASITTNCRRRNSASSWSFCAACKTPSRPETSKSATDDLHPGGMFG